MRPAETAAAQHAPRAAPERCARAEEHRCRQRKLHELRQPPQHQRREQHAKSQPARQPLARPALLGLLAAALRRQLRARAEHRREHRSVRADRPERHHEGIARARSAAHAEHRPQPRLRPVVRARAAQLRRLDRHIKARALYAARDLTEADGRLVIRQACAAGRVAHEHRMHPRQPPQRAHDAHRAGAAVPCPRCAGSRPSFLPPPFVIYQLVSKKDSTLPQFCQGAAWIFPAI